MKHQFEEVQTQQQQSKSQKNQFSDSQSDQLSLNDEGSSGLFGPQQRENDGTTIAENVMKNFQFLQNSLQRALADSENIINNMRSQLDIFNGSNQAKQTVDKWMG